jgi:hypothetical protein
VKLLEAVDTFAVRLYDWSVTDLIRDLNAGCPQIALVGLNNRRLAAFTAWNEMLSARERKSLASALTRRAHERAARVKGEVITEEDRFWFQANYEQTSIFMEQLPPLAYSDQTLSTFKPIDPSQCLDVIQKCISPTLGSFRRRQSSLLCTRVFNDWKVITEFNFRRRDRELSFEYQFIRSDGLPILEITPSIPRSLFMFYGIYASTVQVPSQYHGQPMAEAMVKLAEYFLEHADGLFAGLGISD